MDPAIVAAVITALAIILAAIIGAILARRRKSYRSPPSREPPPWDTAESLSKYFSDADYNSRVTAANYPLVYALLRRVQATFEKVESALEKGRDHHLLIPRFLLIRAHSSILAAIRLATSGQLPESHVILRSAIEQAWYALHIARDPAPPTRSDIWLRRDEGPTGKARCQAEFTVRNVRSTHESIDPKTARQMQNFYEDTIDFGGHPNQQAVLSALQATEGEHQIDYKVGILYPDVLTVMFALRFAVGIAVGVFKVFQLIYPERFTLVGLDTDIDQLVGELNTVFKRYSKPAK